jgi:hypothetical protein
VWFCQEAIMEEHRDEVRSRLDVEEWKAQHRAEHLHKRPAATSRLREPAAPADEVAALLRHQGLNAFCSDGPYDALLSLTLEEFQQREQEGNGGLMTLLESANEEDILQKFSPMALRAALAMMHFQTLDNDPQLQADMQSVTPLD